MAGFSARNHQFLYLGRRKGVISAQNCHSLQLGRDMAGFSAQNGMFEKKGAEKMSFSRPKLQLNLQYPLHLSKCLCNPFQLPFGGGGCAADSYGVAFCEPLRVYLVYRLDVV